MQRCVKFILKGMNFWRQSCSTNWKIIKKLTCWLLKCLKELLLLGSVARSSRIGNAARGAARARHLFGATQLFRLLLLMDPAVTLAGVLNKSLLWPKVPWPFLTWPALAWPALACLPSVRVFEFIFRFVDGYLLPILLLCLLLLISFHRWH